MANQGHGNLQPLEKILGRLCGAAISLMIVKGKLVAIIILPMVQKNGVIEHALTPTDSYVSLYEQLFIVQLAPTCTDF